MKRIKDFLRFLLGDLLSPIPIRLILLRSALWILPFKFTVKEKLEAFNRPWYAYGILNAVMQAKNLGHDAIIIIEFGVARGHGLIELEDLTSKISKEIKVKINIIGFDTGNGLPRYSEDYRDQLYFWRSGDFDMSDGSVMKASGKAGSFMAI